MIMITNDGDESYADDESRDNDGAESSYDNYLGTRLIMITKVRMMKIMLMMIMMMKVTILMLMKVQMIIT